jgi:siderophore synthetase component
MKLSPFIEEETSASGADWTRIFQSERLAPVESRILKQLIETLLYEKIIPFEEEKLVNEKSRYSLPGVSQQGNAVAYSCEGQVKQSFGRFRIRPETLMRMEADGTASAAHLATFATEVLSTIGCNERLPAFYDELVQTLMKDTQAHSYRVCGPLSEADRAYDALEAHVLEGHPYHPCYKSRIGFSLEDNMSFGPEYRPVIKPIWLAITSGDCQTSISRSVDRAAFLSQELGQETLAAFQEKIKLAGGNPERFELMAVHPWQWREVAGAVLYQSIADGRLIVLGESGDEYYPQQSIRTLANGKYKLKAYLKLPLSITNTSTGRILARHTVLNAPLISDWLHELWEQDVEAKQMGAILLREVVGVAFNHETLPGVAQEKAYGTLGTIWRESIHGYLDEGEEAIPFNAMCHVESTGTAFIAPWIEQHGLSAWTEGVIRSSVLPIIHMLFAHGIALESHAQNMLLIHRDGKPVRVAFKDFHDGIRFSRRHLTHAAACPTLHPVPAYHPKLNRNSFIETDDASVVRDFMHDAFFFINLAELCLFLEESFGFAETEFWRMAAQAIHDYTSRHPEHRQRIEAFDLFANTIQVEQLTKRRLFGDSELRVHDVPNPLHRFR